MGKECASREGINSRRNEFKLWPKGGIIITTPNLHAKMYITRGIWFNHMYEGRIGQSEHHIVNRSQTWNRSDYEIKSANIIIYHIAKFVAKVTMVYIYDFTDISVTNTKLGKWISNYNP